MSRRPAPDPSALAGPWGRRDVMVWAGLMVVGCGLIAVAWNGASNELRFEDTVPWLQMAIWGLALTLLADAAWYFGGRQSVCRLRRALLDADGPGHLRAPAIAGLAAVPGAEDFIAAAGMKHYHRPGCQLAEGKAVGTATRADHERADRIACGMCRP